jgi:hypothetical protein
MLSDRAGEVEGKGKKLDGKIKFDSKYCTSVPHVIHLHTRLVHGIPLFIPNLKIFSALDTGIFTPLVQKKRGPFLYGKGPLLKRIQVS